MEFGLVWEWLRANLDVVLAIGSAVVALLSAVMARHETRRQRALQKEQLRQNIDKASVDWGAEAIEAMGEAAALAIASDGHMSVHEIFHERLRVARRISALVDRGRMFFPNLDPSGKGAEKESAYRGSRPPILDAMIYAYNEVISLGAEGPSGMDAAGFITECRRLLVSELQAHLDPRRLDEVIGRYDQQRTAHREEALDRAGQLRLILDVRRPGVMAGHGDEGWASRIGPEERRRILAEYGARRRDMAATAPAEPELTGETA